MISFRHQARSNLLKKNSWSTSMWMMSTVLASATSLTLVIENLMDLSKKELFLKLSTP